MYLAPFYRFQDYKKSHMHIVIFYKLELLKLIGYVGSWNGIATKCRRHAAPMFTKRMNSKKEMNWFFG